MSEGGKGSARRVLDEKKVRKNWPFEDAHELLRKHREHLVYKESTKPINRMIEHADLSNRAG